MKLPSFKQLKELSIPGVLLFGFCGIVLIPFFFYNYHRSNEISQWPKIDAVIVNTGVHAFSRGKHGRTQYEHIFEYQYTFNGITYTEVNYGGFGSAWDSEENARKAFPKLGTVLPVYFNPTQPNESEIYVFVRSESELRNEIIWASIFAALGLALIYLKARKLESE